jgi:hypothetical protein
MAERGTVKHETRASAWRVVKAAALYFVLVFGTGFILGIVRVRRPSDWCLLSGGCNRQGVASLMFLNLKA